MTPAMTTLAIGILCLFGGAAFLLLLGLALDVLLEAWRDRAPDQPYDWDI